MKIRRPETRRARIEIIPMIDVMFFLLIFFMVTSLAMIRANAIPVNLPRTSASPMALRQDLVLTIDKDGHLFLGGKPVTLASEGPALIAAMGRTTQNTLVIDADRAVSHGRVVAAMDAARQVGIEKFAIATDAR